MMDARRFMRSEMSVQTISAGVIAILLIGGSIFYFSRAEPITNYPSQGTDIIAFGDSLIEGRGASSSERSFVTLLAKKIGRPIVNLGHAGDTTADGLARVSELEAYNPKIVLLLLGGNDHLKKMPISETRKNLAALIQYIQSRGAIVVLLGVRGGLFNDPFDTEFEALRDAYHTAYVPDVLDGLFGNMTYMSDAVHPNDAGYGRIAERVYPVLAELLQ